MKSNPLDHPPPPATPPTYHAWTLYSCINILSRIEISGFESIEPDKSTVDSENIMTDRLCKTLINERRVSLY